jgi:hypothetical protein
MLADRTEAWLGARIDHTKTDSRSKTAIAPQRRQAIVVMADFAPAFRTFPISPLNRHHPNRRTNPTFTATVRNHCSNFVFAGLGAKLRPLRWKWLRIRCFFDEDCRNWDKLDELEAELERTNFPVNGTNVLREFYKTVTTRRIVSQFFVTT